MPIISFPQLAARILFGESLELSARQRQALASLDLRTMPTPDGEPWFEALIEAAKREVRDGRAALTSDWSFYMPPMATRASLESSLVWPEDFMPDQPKDWEGDLERWIEQTGNERPRSHGDDAPHTKAPGMMETLAWYQPAHHYAPHEISGICGWGIVIPPAGIARVACLLREKTPSLPETDAVRLAAKVLFYHECGHAVIEDLVCISEHGDGEFGNFLLPALKNDAERHAPFYFGRTARGHLREEAFCNTLALACIRRDFGNADLPVEATMSWMRTQPPGYRHFDASVKPFGSDESLRRIAGMAWLVLWDYTSPEGRWNEDNEAVEIRTQLIEASVDFAYGVRTAQLRLISARRPKPREWPTGFVPVYAADPGVRVFQCQPSSHWLRVIIEASDGILGIEELKSCLKKGVHASLADLIALASLAAAVRTYEPHSALHAMKLFINLAGGCLPSDLNDTVTELSGAGFKYGDERISQDVSVPFTSHDCFIAAAWLVLRKPSGHHHLLGQAGGGSTSDDLGETFLMNLARTKYWISDGKVWNLHGTDVNAQDDHGFTALMWAALFNHDQVVEALLLRGADVNLQNKTGVTALMLASYSARTHYMNWPATNHQYKDDCDPYMLVQKLLDAGADFDALDANGKTATDWAMHYKRKLSKVRIHQAMDTCDRVNDSDPLPVTE